MTSNKPRRSDATRAAILSAARARFATDGYERATIRAIAGDADIDPSIVMRYFGDKSGLFAAVATLSLPVEVKMRLSRVAAESPDRLGFELARQRVAQWESDDTFLALLRAGVSNSAAVESMRDIYREQTCTFVRSVVDTRVEERAAMISAAVLGFAYVRYVLRLEPVVSMSVDDAMAWLGPTLQAYLET